MKMSHVAVAAIVLGLFVSAQVFGPTTTAQKTDPDRISLAELNSLLEQKKPVVILDVRGEIDTKIKGAKHIPLDELESRLSEVPRNHEIVTYCA